MSKWLSSTLLFVFFTVPAFGANLDLTPLQRSLQFNFSFPGARSLGMGGAFIGRADDASAAEANPAGLTVIVKPEVTFELRQLDYAEKVPFGIAGSTGGQIKVSDQHTTPSFFSVVFPSGHSTIALYYSRPFDYQQSASLSTGNGVLGTVAGQQFFFGDAPGNFSVHYKTEAFGVSGAWKLGQMSFGLSARRQRFKGISTFADYDVALSGGSIVKGSPSPTLFGRIEGSDTQYAYTAGWKWASQSENFSVGAVYKSGSDYSVKECNPNSASERCTSANALPSSFEVPTQYGAGVSIRPAPGVTLNADVVHVQYSRLLKHFEPAEFCAGASICKPATSLGFDIPDVNEIHLGGEWAFPAARIPFALRAGWWHDPDHTLRYRGPTTSSDPFEKAAMQYSAFRYPGETAQNHIAFGVGYIAPSFEINAAYDHSSLARTASLSALKRF